MSAILTPFLRLHTRCVSWIFDARCGPPRARGTIWSSDPLIGSGWRSAGSTSSAHIAHRPLSRVHISLRSTDSKPAPNLRARRLWSESLRAPGFALAQTRAAWRKRSASWAAYHAACWHVVEQWLASLRRESGTGPPQCWQTRPERAPRRLDRLAASPSTRAISRHGVEQYRLPCFPAGKISPQVSQCFCVTANDVSVPRRRARR